MSVDCGDEYPDVYSNGLRRARKEHECDACAETIRRGDRYHYTFCVFEGSANTTKRCARCELMYRALLPLIDDESTCDPELNCGHTFENNFGEAPPPELARLAFVTPDEAQALLSARKAS